MYFCVMQVRIYFVFCFWLLFSSFSDKKDNSVLLVGRYKVVGVKDGDTIVLLLNGSEQTVRLQHIDCPEKRQPFGTKAKQTTASLCFGQWVSLDKTTQRDRNGRLLAEVYLADGTCVNKELVRLGMAWHFKKYSKDRHYAALEVQARQQGVGLWRDASPIAPWVWRKQTRNFR
jgi:micrococcal nuclease